MELKKVEPPKGILKKWQIRHNLFTSKEQYKRRLNYYTDAFSPLKYTMISIINLFFITTVILILTSSVSAFTANETTRRRTMTTTTHHTTYLNMAPPASEVTVNNKPVKAKAGQKLSQVMAAAKVKMTYRWENDINTFDLIFTDLSISYVLMINSSSSFAYYINSCKKGNCGTCELLMNGRIEKACVAKIPTGKVKIQTY